MAYRRRQGMSRASTFKEEIIHRPPDDNSASILQSSSSFSGSSSLAAQAIRASALSAERNNNRSKDFSAYDESATKSGFWGVLARKAKAILDEDGEFLQDDMLGGVSSQSSNASTGTQFQQPHLSSDNSIRMENPAIRKGLDRITTSLNQLGDTFEKAFEEGRTMVENKTADIKLQIKRRGDHPEAQAYYVNQSNSGQQPKNPDTQLKASRDVAMATAAKAKLLLRELKTVKADLAFAKERCSQLEEENKRHRENRDKGNHRADDDLIRLQLETLLAEKSRLANENSVYARENRFLREIVEYHQLTMQDVVYLDDEEVTEVYPLTSSTGVSRMLSISPPSTPPSPPPEDPSPVTAPVTEEISPLLTKPQENKDVSANEATPSSNISDPNREDTKTPSSAEAATKTPPIAEAATKSPFVAEADPKTPPTAEASPKTPSVAEDTKRPRASA
ncbi:unnamed protein product [Prunus armeniaca]|uniref:Uncharacterized protein n=1 Tax=Prunus armeniaca TaxID=36596 RepID=A0A6J5V7H1_PRUAR|nr:unnamed protein product [Prunus armeniaca]